MPWRKLGHVFVPDGRKPWMRTHAANPTAEMLGPGRVRIYFSSRDERNRSSIAFVEVDLRAPATILRESEEPVLGPGDLGMFDDCGASIGCIVPVGQRRFLYYMGWHLTVAVPWQNAIGLAISDGPDQPFVRVSRFPVVPLSEVDPYTISYPWVRYEHGTFRMWYGSNTQWGARKEDMRHLIKYAESSDGIHWNRAGIVAVDFHRTDEYAMCRPCVLSSGERYQMWFSSRGDRYRIRYAESTDGLTWMRADDRVGIDVSAEGWDAEMIEYPCVFEDQGTRYLLYAGNGFGKAGFGLAVWEPDQR